MNNKDLLQELEKEWTIMKLPKCLTCQIKTELVICYCSEPQQVYYCWTCQRHYSIKPQ